MYARMQGVENSEFDYVPARQTTLIHRGARKGEGEGEKEREPESHSESERKRAREREREREREKNSVGGTDRGRE